LRLDSDLRTALTGRQFRIHYQPIVDLKTRAVESLEALLRWQHPAQGLISPYRFIEAAEDSGILVSIGHWLILQACRQLREWDANNFSTQPLNLTMNVSARQFAGARLASDIQDALRDTQIDPSRLHLEITEDIALADPKLTITVLSHLKHLGIRIVLDDFGVGATSLRGLQQFPIDALKIDRSLIGRMQADPAACDLVEVIITLAHKMEMKVIAEGVESIRQCERLRELGCELGQGFYFSQPLEAKAAPEFLQRQVSFRGAGAS
jgi:EAL domain-containing protein (putative c-di-GMP-specific phosphodiesterase class I)